MIDYSDLHVTMGTYYGKFENNLYFLQSQLRNEWCSGLVFIFIFLLDQGGWLATQSSPWMCPCERFFYYNFFCHCFVSFLQWTTGWSFAGSQPRLRFRSKWKWKRRGADAMVGRNEHTLDNYACIKKKKKTQVHHIILHNKKP